MVKLRGDRGCCQSPNPVTADRYVRVVAERSVDPSDLVGASEIAARLGVVRDTVHLWRRRHEDFPEPIAELEQAMVWDWRDVERWAKATKRL